MPSSSPSVPAAPPLTDEQRLALETRATSVSLDAGAGCGKTFVLTERYLSHLRPEAAGEEPLALEQIVAITFTDAAAREMRDRIRRKCFARLQAADDEAESGFWLRLLRSLDAARVSTIHSFCGALVRENAAALGLDPTFRVLDQAAAEVLRSEATDRRLRELLVARDERIFETAEHFGLMGLKERIARIGDSRSDPDYRRWLTASPDETVEAWRTYYYSEVAPAVAADFAALPAMRAARSALLAATPSSEAVAARVADLSLSFNDLENAADPHEALAQLRPNLVMRIKGRSFTAKDWPDEGLYNQFKEACVTLRKEIDKLRRIGLADELRNAARLGLKAQQLAEEASRSYADAKREANALDYDDLLVEAHRLLTTEEHAAARRAAARGVGMLLVDEFQDTDRLQTAIVRSLVSDGDAPDGDGEGGVAGGRLFFVGDFKQSIYRFRGAEPTVFRDLRSEIAPEGRLPLSTNFRSQPAVIEFVNSAFSGLFGEEYTPLRAARPQATPRPAVEFLWTDFPDAPEGKTKASTREQRGAEARAIARRLHEMLQGGECVVADSDNNPRPARPGDIALLFRAMSDVQHYEEALRDAGINYYLVGGHAFYSQQEVFDVLNLLRTVDSVADGVSLAGVLRSPFFALLDETLFWLAQARGGLQAGLFNLQTRQRLSEAERRKTERAAALIGALRTRKSELGAAGVLREALSQTGYDAALLAEFLGERKLANLQKLVDQARTSDASGAGLGGYVRQLSEFTARQPKEALAATSSGSADVVRLMTVHHAKGLEFPIVVLPDLERRDRPDSPSAAFHPRLGPLVRPTDREDSSGAVGIDLYRTVESRQASAEQDRLFYVACTRAADYLILSSTIEDPGKLKGPWLRRLSERFDLETGDFVGEGPAPHERLVVVRRGDDRPLESAPTKRVDLGKVIEKARRLTTPRAAKPVAGVEPIAIDPGALKRFSVSRLTGRLHRATAAPRTAEDDSLEDLPPVDAASLESLHGAKVDPLGLGVLTHAVMERLPLDGATPETIAELSQSLAPLHLRRGADAAAALAAALAAEMVGRFVATPRFAAMRASQRLERETEFLLDWRPTDPAGAPALLQGYIDAMHLGEDGAWRIVDYKTNHTDAAGVGPLAEHYRLQMGVYALAAERALGASPASLTLSFLRPGVEVEFVWDKEMREETTRRIDEAIASARELAPSP
ncbi:ATP-dependent helicase/nuclease subunit A [Pseudobythopirellula maris]|uniref:DNA 3'-5' helicase n=1 Tax=Pseudobythopirellula maris TaxID=2527991 RepID=A0A5C5ZTL4_9BACT|nr:UvrD-helicase domain-containing protein [Pseudobythopirellula maris]TWT90556.1 ATP-dependent helicase/nuclease subunit A [Pseudobythopirellula maris]